MENVNIYQQELDSLLAENETYSINTDLQADKAIERIKIMEKGAERFKKLIDDKITELKAQFDTFNSKIEAKKDFYIYHLQQYLATVNPDMLRKTKAGNKIYDLSAGKITMSKKIDWVYDKKDVRFIEYLEKNGLKDYIKTDKFVDWATLKKELDLVDNQVVSKSNGTIFPEDILSGSEVDEFKVGYENG